MPSEFIHVRLQGSNSTYKILQGFIFPIRATFTIHLKPVNFISLITSSEV